VSRPNPLGQRLRIQWLTVTSSSARPAQSGHVKGLRLDIQLLRAVAVALVVVYHLWPLRLPSGFIGVDVFFVISGFLITAHLLKQAEGPSGIKVFKFWANRALRLLPMACLVLLATIWAVIIWMPQSVWQSSLRNIVGSALYVQNWLLASDSVSYLARDEHPPITQHFWSLSVEEQFYIAWPILLVVATVLALRTVGKNASPATRTRAIRRAIFGVIAAIALVSFVVSLWLTSSQPDLAYFATTTRAWEFAGGGLIAFAALKSPAWFGSSYGPALRALLSWAAYLTLAATALLLPVGAPFPGLAALLPVVATMLALWVGDVKKFYSPTVVARFRPVTYVGDISYGIYLWHWPLIVVAPFILGGPLTTPQKLLVGLIAVVLAGVSKIVVEDPIRFGSFWRTSVRRGFYPAAIGMLAVTLIATSSSTVIARGGFAVAAQTASTTQGMAAEGAAPLVPTLANRGTDRANMYDCFDLDHTTPHVCKYGFDDAPVRIAITGDSHAAQFIPALTQIVEQNGWSLTTFVGVSCDAALDGQQCAGGADYAAQLIAGNFDVVLTSAYRDSFTDPNDVRAYWKTLVDGGVKLLPIADVPLNPQASFDCIDASDGDPAAARACVTPIDVALNTAPDRVAALADELQIPFIDLTDEFCDDAVCHTVRDRTIIYQDSPTSHITATFGMLLAPRLNSEIRSAIGVR
jgi:peptidoglycan/LPS O-acetylase OafA/YrhL